MAYIDFRAIKSLVSLTQVAAWLGLEVRNNRCRCPRNQGDTREMVFNPEGTMWHCFGCGEDGYVPKKGGDQIALVAHVKQIPQKTAALELQRAFHGYTPEKRGFPENGISALPGIAYEHERVQQLGISPERAKQLGIAYRDKGTTRKKLLIELRDEKGAPVGAIQIAEDGSVQVPKNLQDVK
jgi:hypothetical protein